MTLIALLVLFQSIPPEEVEPYHAMDNVNIQQPLPSLVGHVAHHPLQHLHLPTTPTSLGQAVCVMFRRILLYSSSSVPRYLIRELQLMFYLFDEIYESTKYFSKCIASTNWHSLTPHFFSGHPVLRFLLGQGYSSNIIGVNIKHHRHSPSTRNRLLRLK